MLIYFTLHFTPSFQWHWISSISSASGCLWVLAFLYNGKVFNYFDLTVKMTNRSLSALIRHDTIEPFTLEPFIKCYQTVITILVMGCYGKILMQIFWGMLTYHTKWQTIQLKIPYTKKTSVENIGCLPKLVSGKCHVKL